MYVQIATWRRLTLVGLFGSLGTSTLHGLRDIVACVPKGGVVVSEVSRKIGELLLGETYLSVFIVVGCVLRLGCLLCNVLLEMFLGENVYGVV